MKLQKKELIILMILSLSFFSTLVFANNEILNNSITEDELENEINNQIGLPLDNNMINDEQSNLIIDKESENLNLENDESREINNECNLPFGVYRITAATNETLSLDVSGASTEDRANVQIWNYENAPQQKFIIQKEDDGYYIIKNLNSGKVLDVQDASMKNGANVWQYFYNGSDAQKWIIQRTSDGYYNIVSKLNGLYLNIDNANIVKGANIQVYASNESVTQKFRIDELESLVGEKTLEEGIYKILNFIDSSKCIEVSGGSTEDRANVQIWNYENASQQKFKLEYDGQGYYTIRNLNSGKVLDVQDASMKSGANVWQYFYNGSDAQKWIIRKNEDESYSIFSKLTGYCLDIQNGDLNNGANIQVYSNNSSGAQKFSFTQIAQLQGTKTIEEGTYKILNFIDSSKCIEVSGGSTEDRANVQIWNYENAPQQKFKIEYDGQGYYTIRNLNSGKVLDVQDASMKSGANVWQYFYNGSDAQKWIIRKNEDESYSIFSKLTGYCLDIQNGDLNNGANIQVYNDNGSGAQKFLFTQIYPMQGTKSIEEGIYKISCKSNENMTLEVENSSQNNEANIQIWNYVGGDQQKFKIKYEGSGYYTIQNLQSGKYLDVKDGSLQSGTLVWQYEYNGSDSQKWIIQKTDDGYFNIISKLSEYYLDIQNGSIINGSHVQVYVPNGSDAQKFKFTKKDEVSSEKTIEDGTYRIALASNNNIGLDVSNAGRDNGTNVQTWEYTNVVQQQFNIVYVGDGYYNIIAVHSGKVLDIENAGKTNGTNVWQYEYNNSDAQKWVIKDLGNNKYNIISKIDGMYLDVSNGLVGNGINIQIYEGNGSVAQEFQFIKIDDKSERTLEDGIYRIATSLNLDYGLDITAGSKDNNANVQLWHYDYADQQKFLLEYKDGYYNIKNLGSEKNIAASQDGLNVEQYEINDSDNQKWIIRATPDGNVKIISKFNKKVIDVCNAEVNRGTNIQLYEDNNSGAQRFKFIYVNPGINIDTNRYPGIKERVNELVIAHPNWQFEVLYTGIDFYTAVQGEYEYYSVDRYGNKHPANLVDTNVYKGDWIAPNPIVSGNWAQASYNGIAYFMDPRNFLNDVDVFQFVDLADYYNSGATLDSIQYQVNGTFLNNFAEDVRISCEHQNVNPYYIIARLFQEQGRNGSITIYMDGGDGKTYFNPFNIGAVVGDDFNTALAKAKEQGWDSMQKGLEGGISFIKRNYLDVHQNTLYLNKFDVNPNSGSSFYSHQYQQNLSAAYSEARNFRSSYVSTGTLDNTIKFIIPVYENMPDTLATRPSGSGTSTEPDLPEISDQKPMYVQTYDIQSYLTLRSGPGQQYGKIGELQNGKTMISMARYTNGWQKVFLIETGEVGYCSGDFLQFVDDPPTNCNNDRVAISTKSTVNVRNAPTSDDNKSTILASFRNGTTGTRILKDYYFFDGHWWNLVLFDDGTRGFVVSDYLIEI